MKQYTRHYSTTQTPQSQPIPGETMVPNEAGGYGFQVDDWSRLDRFLLIGTTGGTYYVSEQKLTTENADAVLRCIQSDGLRTVRRIMEISDAGRAPKNDPAIFALALAAKKGNDATRKAAFDAVPRVCRIGTHLIAFAEALQAFGGWGQGTMRAVGGWFQRDVDAVAYQAVKYRQREGWTLADLLRLSHPKPTSALQDHLFKWIVDGINSEKPDVPRVVLGFELAQKATDPKELARLVRDYDLPREALPTGALNHAQVWEALLEKMPLTAMIRNLGKMSEIGLLKPFSDGAVTVISRLGDAEYLRKSRVHPFAVLVALKTYASGQGLRGSLKWTPVPQIIDALNAAFYASFGNVRPTGKRIVLGIDVSGSMDAPVMGIMSAKEAAAALALILVKTEPNVITVCFDTSTHPTDISRAKRIDDVMRVTRQWSGGTDCAQPVLWAAQSGIRADGFVLYTDEETWAGSVHPIQAVRNYRKRWSEPGWLVSAAMAATGARLVPDGQQDPRCLAVIGFDSSTPALISQFLSA